MKSEKDAGDGTAGREMPDPPREQSPFERFEEFARKVISVPRAEIKKREREYKERRDDPDRRRPA